ncbi:MAG: protein kinase [Steroidobacteraceae bacterium]
MSDAATLDQRAFAILESLVEAPPGTREQTLQSLATESPALHRRVVALLAADAAAALDTAALGPVITAAPPDLSGSLVGRYRLLEPIGSGGMGVVYRARREDDVEQQVAVKLVRQELRSASSLARFHVERQALARLEHPGIARLIDAGISDDGRPWYVMEYVDGVPIDDYCRDRQLGVRAGSYSSSYAAPWKLPTACWSCTAI